MGNRSRFPTSRAGRGRNHAHASRLGEAAEDVVETLMPSVAADAPAPANRPKTDDDLHASGHRHTGPTAAPTTVRAVEARPRDATWRAWATKHMHSLRRPF